MKKKTITPEGFQPNEELEPFTIEDLQKFSYSLADSSSELREFSDSDFEVFTDEELKAMTFAIEELKAMSWN